MTIKDLFRLIGSIVSGFAGAWYFLDLKSAVCVALLVAGIGLIIDSFRK